MLCFTVSLRANAKRSSPTPHLILIKFDHIVFPICILMIFFLFLKHISPYHLFSILCSVAVFFHIVYVKNIEKITWFKHAKHRHVFWIYARNGIVFDLDLHFWSNWTKVNLPSDRPLTSISVVFFSCSPILPNNLNFYQIFYALKMNPCHPFSQCFGSREIHMWFWAHFPV